MIQKLSFVDETFQCNMSLTFIFGLADRFIYFYGFFKLIVEFYVLWVFAVKYPEKKSVKMKCIILRECRILKGTYNNRSTFSH